MDPRNRRGPGLGLDARLRPQRLHGARLAHDVDGADRRSAPPPERSRDLVVLRAGLDVQGPDVDRGAGDRGDHAATTVVSCSGSVVIYNRRFMCWKKGGHGTVDVHRALVHSCNVFYYLLGKKVGIDAISKYAKMFGIGELSGIDLPGESRGNPPSAEWKMRIHKEQWYPGDTISVSIGQGLLAVTPVQMATMISAVANGGTLVRPHLARDAEVAPDEAPGVAPATLTLIRDALGRRRRRGDRDARAARADRGRGKDRDGAGLQEVGRRRRRQAAEGGARPRVVHRVRARREAGDRVRHRDRARRPRRNDRRSRRQARCSRSSSRTGFPKRRTPAPALQASLAATPGGRAVLDVGCSIGSTCRRSRRRWRWPRSA